MSQYIRKGIFTPDEVLPYMWTTANYIKYYVGDDNKLYPVKMKNSGRYICFIKQGLNCVECGVKGKFFALEKCKSADTSKFHFNLYAIGKNGGEILMTKDHIIPKSCGGMNHILNYQTMCQPCNKTKGNKFNRKSGRVRLMAAALKAVGRYSPAGSNPVSSSI